MMSHEIGKYFRFSSRLCCPLLPLNQALQATSVDNFPSMTAITSCEVETTFANDKTLNKMLIFLYFFKKSESCTHKV